MAIPLQRLGDLLTRIDELLVQLLKVQEQQLKLLERLAPAPPIPPTITEKIIKRHEEKVPITEIAREFKISVETIREIIEEKVVPPPGVTEVMLRTESIIKLAEELAKRILQLPNRLEKIEWDTSNTDWKNLRDEEKIKPDKALGFWVEDIGGGFEYKIVREKFESNARTAEKDDKWDQEFDNLLVKGAGVGTALIWYWWREE